VPRLCALLKNSHDVGSDYGDVSRADRHQDYKHTSSSLLAAVLEVLTSAPSQYVCRGVKCVDALRSVDPRPEPWRYPVPPDAARSGEQTGPMTFAALAVW
jgi:hypothetical protein